MVLATVDVFVGVMWPDVVMVICGHGRMWLWTQPWREVAVVMATVGCSCRNHVAEYGCGHGHGGMWLWL